MVFFDRVKETTTTVGTGAITLAGATSGFVSFASVMTVGGICYYCIQGQTPGEWETGIGTYSGTNTLTRTTPLAGSAATPVSFSAGIKDIFITVGAAYFGSVQNHTADGADYALAPGETIFKTYSSATSVPLYVAVSAGIYELTLSGDISVVPSAGNILLDPNAGSLPANSVHNYMLYLGGSNSDPTESITPAAYKLRDNRFFLDFYNAITISAKISTFTKAKTVSVNSFAYSGGGLIQYHTATGVWDDSTTAWTSLGALVFPFAQNGTIIIKRII